MTVHVRADTETVDILRFMFGTRLTKGPVGPDGRMDAEIRGQSEEMLARPLAGLGARFEVITPDSVRQHLAEIGRTLTEHHGEGATPAPAPIPTPTPADDDSARRDR